ncbi:Sarcolemmal membrane-associated protein, partial [Larimichthys crocea]
RLEQLQEKSVKENNSLDVDIVSHGPVEEPVEDKQSLETSENQEEDEDDDDTDTDDGAVGEIHDNCHVNNSGGDSTRIQQLIECPPVKQLKETVSSSIHKLANFDEVMDAHLQNNQTAEDDILASPDRLKDGNMDDQELNEPQNRVALLKAELHRAGLEPGDTEQVIHHLHRELLEAQELANIGKQRCLELQAQLGKLQADMEALREQRESTIFTTREELYSAQGEIIVLRHTMEAATAEREREIAALQADLGSVRSELEHWRNVASKYEQEISRLQDAFTQQQQQQSSATKLQGVPQGSEVWIQQDEDKKERRRKHGVRLIQAEQDEETTAD